jgi:hypothetical protein
MNGSLLQINQSIYLVLQPRGWIKLPEMHSGNDGRTLTFHWGCNDFVGVFAF